MRGIDVPHSTQYHLGACCVCFSSNAGIAEAITVVFGSHVCGECAMRIANILTTITPTVAAPSIIHSAIANHPAGK